MVICNKLRHIKGFECHTEILGRDMQIIIMMHPFLPLNYINIYTTQTHDNRSIITHLLLFLFLLSCLDALMLVTMPLFIFLIDNLIVTWSEGKFEL